tara:strand:+ start:401 stop:766 length:366 start_codon:yes stop_codon:yes gene_type:complete
MSHEKKEAVESLVGSEQYLLMAADAEGISTYTYAEGHILASMLMNFFNEHPDIYKLMHEAKMASEIGQMAEKALGTEKAQELVGMLSQLLSQGEEEEEEEEEGLSMDDMQKFMDGLFSDNK